MNGGAPCMVSWEGGHELVAAEPASDAPRASCPPACGRENHPRGRRFTRCPWRPVGLEELVILARQMLYCAGQGRNTIMRAIAWPV